VRHLLYAVVGVVVLALGAVVVAQPLIGAASHPVPTVSAFPDGAVSQSPSPAPASPSSAATPADCRGATDPRTTAAQKKAPFTVCGVELINKEHRVSAAYSPKLVKVAVRAYGVSSVKLQPVAAGALVRFFGEARRAGYTPVVRSSYRSYAIQKTWYATMSHTLTAPPGASEHQSGLAVDLAGIERGRLVHGTALASSKTGAWLLKHAADYGFILRYPTSQAKITGIAYEPWHFRYVGVKVAKGVEATKTKTLERYLGVG
jgi:D-alanyl-D-alanine carboxypeptidase